MRYHGFTAQLLDLILANGDKEKYLNIFKETVDDISLELLLLMHADLLGSDLEINDKQAFDDRIKLIQWLILHN